MRNLFIDTVADACRARDDVFLISGDAGLGVLDKFRKTYPGRFLNLGVAEQNAASFSAGLSMAGFKVYLYNIIPFLIYRCYEQVRNDICYQRLPVVLVGIGSGVTYAPQGMSHYSVEDIGLAQTLPNLTVISPIDPIEAKAAALYSLNSDGPVYVRMAKSGEENIHKNEVMNIAAPQLVDNGEGVAIVFHGSIAKEVVEAKEMLVGEGIYPRLISVPMVKPMDLDALFKMLADVDHVISVEEHFIDTGIGDIMSKEYVRTMPRWKFRRIGIPDKFIHEIKDNAGMREHFGISSRGIADAVRLMKRVG